MGGLLLTAGMIACPAMHLGVRQLRGPGGSNAGR
jgi:hypothetical protein